MRSTYLARIHCSRSVVGDMEFGLRRPGGRYFCGRHSRALPLVRIVATCATLHVSSAADVA